MQPAVAQSISPLRAVLTPNAPETQFTLTNPTDQSVAVDLSWTELTALENGAYEAATAEERDKISAAVHLSLSPARFQLAAGESRKISVNLRSGITLPPEREFRSHLLIRFSAAGPLRKASASLPVNMKSAISVPVILRDRSASAQDGRVSLSDVRLRRLADGGLALDVLIDRHGPYSFYGAVTAAAVITPDGMPEIIARRENVSLYTDNERRMVSIELGVSSLPETRLDLSFEGRGEYNGKIFRRRLFDIRPPTPVSQ